MDYAGDENYIMRTVGEPEQKNTFGLNLCFMQGALICVWLKLGLCQPVNLAQSSTPYKESLRHGAHVGLEFHSTIPNCVTQLNSCTQKNTMEKLFHTSKLV